ERDSVLLYMRHRTGFGNCNDVAVADGPGQRNSGCRAAVCCADTYKRGITQHAGTGSAERRISHHRHAVLLALWQQVTLYAAVAEAVRELISRADRCRRSDRIGQGLERPLSSPAAPDGPPSCPPSEADRKRYALTEFFSV